MSKELNDNVVTLIEYLPGGRSWLEEFTESELYTTLSKKMTKLMNDQTTKCLSEFCSESGKSYRDKCFNLQPSHGKETVETLINEVESNPCHHGSFTFTRELSPWRNFRVMVPKAFVKSLKKEEEVEINGNNDAYVDFFAEIDTAMKFVLGLEGRLPPKVFDDIFRMVDSFDVHLSGKQNDVFDADDLEFYKGEFETVEKRIVSLLKAQFYRDVAGMIENVGEIEKLNAQFGAIVGRDAIRSRIEPAQIVKISERIKSLLEGSLNLESVEDWCEFYKNRISDVRIHLSGRKEGLLYFLAKESLDILKLKVEKAKLPTPQE